MKRITYDRYIKLRDEALKIDKDINTFLEKLDPSTAEFYYEIAELYEKFDTLYIDYIKNIMVNNESVFYKGEMDITNRTMKETEKVAKKLSKMLKVPLRIINTRL